MPAEYLDGSLSIAFKISSHVQISELPNLSGRVITFVSVENKLDI